MPVLGHYCLFSRSGNLPFLKPNLIERYAKRRAEGSTFAPKKLMSVRNLRTVVRCRQGVGICTMQVPNTSADKPTSAFASR